MTNKQSNGRKKNVIQSDTIVETTKGDTSQNNYNKPLNNKYNHIDSMLDQHLGFDRLNVENHIDKYKHYSLDTDFFHEVDCVGHYIVNEVKSVQIEEYKNIGILNITNYFNLQIGSINNNTVVYNTELTRLTPIQNNVKKN